MRMLGHSAQPLTPNKIGEPFEEWAMDCLTPASMFSQQYCYWLCVFAGRLCYKRRDVRELCPLLPEDSPGGVQEQRDDGEPLRVLPLPQEVNRATQHRPANTQPTSKPQTFKSRPVNDKMTSAWYQYSE